MVIIDSVGCQHVCGFEDTIMKPERTKSVPAFMFSKNKHIKGEHMEFYQLKITRKGTKPPVWRRCLVPADTDFAKLAAMLEDILEYADTENYEFEFFQKKLRLQNLEAQTAEATKGSYEYAEAKGRQIAELLDIEAWFTFRVKGMKLPEYRTDIEKKITDEEKAGTPEILKETRSAEDDFWTADMQTKNTELEKKYGALGIADIVAKKVAEMEKKMEPEQQENSFSRNPKVRDYLNSYNKEDLIASAIELDIEIDGLSKEELAENITEKVLNPEIMKEIFLQADEWEADAFEEILDKKCFSATEEDWIKLGWLSDAGYVVSYSDHHAEVPKAVISLYKEINTPEFHKLCRQVSWMRSCQTMLGFIYAIAPLKIVYRMYRRRPEYKVSYDEFLKILEQVPENDNMCIVRDGKMIFKSVLQDNLYERIEEYQGDREFYMPSPEEVLDYAKHGYPSEDPSYKKLENFLREELHLNTVQVIELMYIVFKEFSMDGMLSDIMEEFNNKNVVFDSEKQTEEFAAIMMNVNNNTRMLDFRGYTPNEIARMSSPKASSAVMPSMVPMGSLASTPSFIPSNAATKKIYPNDPCPCGSGKKYKKCCGRK